MRALLRKTFSRPNFHPVFVGSVEGYFLRGALALLAVSALWKPLNLHEQPLPRGIAHFVDLTFLGDPGVFEVFRIVAAVAALLYALRLFLPLSLPLLAVCHITYQTLYNSQGPTHHDHQMVSLALLAQACVVLFFPLYRLVRKRPFGPLARTNLDGILLYAAQSAIAGVYVASALTKLSKSDGLWVFKSHLFAKSLIKTDRQRLYDTLDYGAYGGAVPAAEWIAGHPHLARLMFSGGFFAEFFAFMALCNRRWALAMGVALIVMHQMVERMMNLQFYENQWMCAIFLVAPAYWILVGLRRLGGWPGGIR
ncbi:hypothetical protein BH23VER1_BH23VER1_14570 [soil metagenome]